MKIIKVKVIPNAKKDMISEGENIKVYTKSPAINNKANISVIELLANYFKIKKGNINIIKGQKSRNKIIEIK